MKRRSALGLVLNVPEMLGKLIGGTAVPRRHGPAPLFMLLLALVSSATVQTSQIRTSLRASAEGDMATFWTVRDAGIREDFGGTTAFLEVQNTSDHAIGGALFYGEYFDDAGRFCFSLAFSQDNNDGEKGPIPPGESRRIGSLGSGLFSAAEPKMVKVYLIQLKLLDGAQSVRKWDFPIRAPVTVEAGLRADEGQLWLGPELANAKEPVLSLLLAKVSVDEKGTPDHIEVLNTTGSGVESWFDNFIHRLFFFPATNGLGVPVRGETIVFVRAALEQNDPQSYFLPPRMSPWVKSYVQGLTGALVPPVTSIVVGRPPTKFKPMNSSELVEIPPAPPGLFEPIVYESYWSNPAVNRVQDLSMPHHMRMEFAVAPAQ